MRTLALVIALGGCAAAPDKPVLANVPRPNPATVAGGAAAAAAAITLADPDAAARRAERKADAEKKPIRVDATVPADVLDRLDRGSNSAPPPRPEPAPAPPRTRDALDFSGPDGPRSQRF